jgi:hypothetical protein
MGGGYPVTASSEAAGRHDGRSGRGWLVSWPNVTDETTGIPRGLLDQLRATFAAGRRLAQSHLDLARAELGEILEEVGRVAAFVGGAIAAAILLAILLPVGLVLFLGEWIFGSIGWGLLHATLLLVAVAVVLPLIAFVIPAGVAGRLFALAVIVGIGVSLLLGFDLTNRGWQAVGDTIVPGSAASDRAIQAGALVMAAAGAILGLLLGARSGGAGGAFGGLFGGAILGALLGCFTAIAFGPRVGVAVGVAVGIGAWPVMCGLAAWRAGIDTDALKARFIPSVTVETTKETIEWVRAQTPLGRKS